MKNFLKLAGTLFIITFAAAALLGGVNALTKDRIAEAALEKKNTAMQTLLPEADEFSAVTDSISEGRAEGAPVGYCVSAESSGYGGDISIMVGIGADGRITGIEILSNSETAGLGANCTKDEFKGQFAGLSYPVSVAGKSTSADSGGGEISAITGATITSKAVAAGVNSAYDALTEAGITFEGGKS